jgi:hypothetical protein
MDLDSPLPRTQRLATRHPFIFDRPYPSMASSHVPTYLLALLNLADSSKLWKRDQDFLVWIPRNRSFRGDLRLLEPSSQEVQRQEPCYSIRLGAFRFSSLPLSLSVPGFADTDKFRFIQMVCCQIGGFPVWQSLRDEGLKQESKEAKQH